MDKKQINRLQNLLRKDFKKSEVYSQARKRAQIDKALFKCELCGKLVYDGKSVKNRAKLAEKHGEISDDKLEIDHIESVIGYDEYYYTVQWNDFIPRVFCGIDNLQYICKSGCHKEKTAKEAKIRALMRAERKSKEKEE